MLTTFILIVLKKKTAKRREGNELEGERRRVWDRMKRKEAGSGGGGKRCARTVMFQISA